MGCVMWFTRIGKENLAEMAQMDLRETKPMPLSGTLTQLIESNREKLVATQAHPLLGKPAPDFTLKDADGNDVRLSEKLKKGPVVLVFYLGYWCDHCVSQLFGLNEDYNYFRETGAEVLAVSSDPIQLTQERYAEYGRFKFPVLTDPDHLIAQKFGVYAPAGEGRKEWEIHGTYVINSQGIIIWAQTGKKPFTGNPTLLTELAGLSSSLPAPSKPE
jgi:peroxiredoxin